MVTRETTVSQTKVRYIYQYCFIFFIMQVELLEVKSTDTSGMKLITFAALVSTEQVIELYKAEKNSLIELVVDGNISDN